ncbi:TIGR02281 family clan AA aspartic protease [Alteromonas sp. ASW11-19]|uniref:TIGR02281 family clan AA aspartic protease n=1 Tax=Alteromonas salexigens TaxID=2982530 RepID=A0ABT2VQH1_9ALTE|nr:TIGR02281 family clan AA aspartic protease [Alteromonas salexigens]MCU7555550.1 TIGR02281 family clan AA aspartic protease [Alteromonas salexigens]
MTQNSSGAGKWMFVLAWVCAFGLLILVFGDLLEQQVNPNQQPKSMRIDNQTEVRLKQNHAGHYVTSGFINGTPVTFLVDTGATDVAVPAHLQDDLGLIAGRRGLAQTANGTVTVAETRIDRLQIGDIELNNIRGNLNPGMQSDQILLGMSVLKQLEFTQRGEWLILRTL